MNLKKCSGDIVEQVVRPTGLLDPVIEIRPVATQVDDVLSEINERVKLNERVLITTLTKRMAEDLSEYLNENGVKVRYLHSDIDTVERRDYSRFTYWQIRCARWDQLAQSRRLGYARSIIGCDFRCRQRRFPAC